MVPFLGQKTFEFGTSRFATVHASRRVDEEYRHKIERNGLVTMLELLIVTRAFVELQSTPCQLVPVTIRSETEMTT